MVVYDRFQYKSSTENMFGVLLVLGRWSRMGGGRLCEVVARGGSTVRSKGTDGFKIFLLVYLSL